MVSEPDVSVLAACESSTRWPLAFEIDRESFWLRVRRRVEIDDGRPACVRARAVGDVDVFAWLRRRRCRPVLIDPIALSAGVAPAQVRMAERTALQVIGRRRSGRRVIDTDSIRPPLIHERIWDDLVSRARIAMRPDCERLACGRGDRREAVRVGLGLRRTFVGRVGADGVVWHLRIIGADAGEGEVIPRVDGEVGCEVLHASGRGRGVALEGFVADGAERQLVLCWIGAVESQRVDGEVVIAAAVEGDIIHSSGRIEDCA